jgi:hypothetical protein
VDPGFIASNSVDVDIDDEEEPYGTTRAVDSDNDYPVVALSEQKIVTPGFPKNKTRLIICVPRKSTHMSE